MDITVILGLLVASMTAVLAVFLTRSWLRQETRLLTDLPLMFGIVSVAQAFNMLLQTLPRAGWVEPTLELFKLRALVIAGTVVPLLGVVLHIWLHKYQHYHLRAMALTTFYWILTVLFGPSELFIMALLIPVLLSLMLAMLVTFIITWRTGRLEEVRSDILVLALVVGVIGQGIKAPLTAMGLEIIPDILSMVMMMLATVGLINPWFRLSSSRTSQELVSPASNPETDEEVAASPLLSRMNLLPLALGILALSIAFRLIDVLILNLGDTWLNILPSKVLPLAIILFVFWHYRPKEIHSVLGISDSSMVVHLGIGVLLFFILFVIVDLGAVVLYATMLDPSYPLTLDIVNTELLPYVLFFFLVNAIMEETLFRGVLQNGLKTRFSVNKAIAISALTFGVWHACWVLVTGEIMSGIALVVFSGILGAFFGVYYERFSSGKSLMAPIMAHTLFNFFNETVKVGPVTGYQGPDVYTNPAILSIGMILFLVAFPILFVLAGRYRVEDVERRIRRWNKPPLSAGGIEKAESRPVAPTITHPSRKQAESLT